MITVYICSKKSKLHPPGYYKSANSAMVIHALGQRST